MEVWSFIKGILFNPIVIGPLTFPFTLFTFLLEFLLPGAVLFALYRLFRFLLKRFVTTAKFKEATRSAILRWGKRVLRIILFLVLVILLGRLFSTQKVSEYLTVLYSLINQPLFVSGATRISVITLLLTIPIFYLAAYMGRASRKIFRHSAFSRVGLDESQIFSLSNIVRYSVMVIVLLIGLSFVGINLSTLTVIFGVLGIGLGFGLQSVVSNFFSGIVIILTRPIKEGDAININGIEGNVITIRIISTVVSTIRHETIIVPNSDLVNNVVHNFSYDDRRIIIINSVQVSYNSDLDQVLNILQEVAKQNPEVLTVPHPDPRVQSFDDSGITVAVLCWIKDVSKKYSALSWNNLEIWRAFKHAGIEIPFPQMDIHMKPEASVKKELPS